MRRKPFAAWPVFDDRERRAVLDVLESGIWGGYSPKVSEFERAFAAFHQAAFGIAAANGTVTLEAALLAAGVGPGDEVIVPPVSFIATATAVSRVGATPVFADIDAASYNLDPARAADAITPRTRAMIPVHFAGQPADMDALLDIARRHNLVVIEDAAHAHGAAWRGRMVGSFGNFGSFSFQQSKTMTAGEGGILLTSDEELAERARAVSNQGRRKGGAWYEHTSLGANYRLTGWQAAVLLAQLARLPEQLKRRARNAAVLDRRLGSTGMVRPPAVDARVTRHGYYLYVLGLDGSVPRDLFLQALEAEGIPGASAYPRPLYRNAVFDALPHRIEDCPEGERFCRECFWVSHEVLLADESDLDDFVRAVEKIRDGSRELVSAARV